MTERNDHTEAADEADRRAEEMEERSERLAGDIEDTRQDWEHKQADDKVPGATGGEEPHGEEAERVAIAGSSDEDKSPDADAEVGDPDTSGSDDSDPAGGAGSDGSAD
jgi:hypothetical protein